MCGAGIPLADVAHVPFEHHCGDGRKANGVSGDLLRERVVAAERQRYLSRQARTRRLVWIDCREKRAASRHARLGSECLTTARSSFA
jgi:hypothetical protein